MRQILILATVLLLALGNPLLAGRKSKNKNKLIRAVEDENVFKVQELIAGGADVNACQHYESALRVAAGTYKNLQITRMLLDAGAEADHNCGWGWSPLHAAAAHSPRAVLEALLEGDVDVDVRCSEEQTPLHQAVGPWRVDAEAVEVLIRAGATVDALDKFQRTPLMVAARKTQTVESVRLLLEAGADPFGVDGEGLSVLDQIDTPSDYNHGVERPAPLRAAIRGLIESKLAAYRAELERKRQREEAAAHKASLEKIWERDVVLPLDVRHDKYMVALTDHLKHERYRDALDYFELLERLEVELAPSFDFYHGEALLRVDRPREALEKLYSYIQTSGVEGEHYTRALQLVNDAERSGEL